MCLIRVNMTYKNQSHLGLQRLCLWAKDLFISSLWMCRNAPYMFNTESLGKVSCKLVYLWFYFCIVLRLLLYLFGHIYQICVLWSIKMWNLLISYSVKQKFMGGPLCFHCCHGEHLSVFGCQWHFGHQMALKAGLLTFWVSASFICLAFLGHCFDWKKCLPHVFIYTLSIYLSVCCTCEYVR